MALLKSIVAYMCLKSISGYETGISLADHFKVGIVGGHRVPIEHVPFMASVRLNETYHWCGGSIIHEQFILTAAHCIEENIQYKVVVGTDQVENGGQLYEVEKIIIHESYSNETNDYDICIIKLTKPLVFGPKIQKVLLPRGDTKIRRNSLVTATGWGFTKVNGNISNELLQVTIPVVSTRSCQMKYFAALVKITPRMFCAGATGKDSCQGDSGGPLIYEGQQLGVTSFGIGCGTLPGIYTKVPVMMPWILKTVEENL